MSDFVIDTHQLRKQFGNKLAVADLTLMVHRAEVFGFLGPNGAGKTTSIKMLLGLIAPTAGTARVLGFPLGNADARSKVGFLPEHFRFHDWLTGREFLQFHGKLYRMPASQLANHIDELLAPVDLVDAVDRKLREYSKGMLQRIGSMKGHVKNKLQPLAAGQGLFLDSLPPSPSGVAFVPKVLTGFVSPRPLWFLWGVSVTSASDSCRWWSWLKLCRCLGLLG